jgi:hypothetical protein
MQVVNPEVLNIDAIFDDYGLLMRGGGGYKC